MFFSIQFIILMLLFLCTILYFASCFLQFFSDVFIEDPIFVCEVGQSKLNSFDTNSTGRKSVKERQQALIKAWCDLLEVRKFNQEK